MSLFQARDWWTYKPGADESYDTGCVCVANVDNEPNGPSKCDTSNVSNV
jgi:hypothetical protein